MNDFLRNPHFNSWFSEGRTVLKKTIVLRLCWILNWRKFTSKIKTIKQILIKSKQARYSKHFVCYKIFNGFLKNSDWNSGQKNYMALPCGLLFPALKIEKKSSKIASFIKAQPHDVMMLFFRNQYKSIKCNAVKNANIYLLWKMMRVSKKQVWLVIWYKSFIFKFKYWEK
jgi:hypothetical protein